MDPVAVHQAVVVRVGIGEGEDHSIGAAKGCLAIAEGSGNRQLPRSISIDVVDEDQCIEWRNKVVAIDIKLQRWITPGVRRDDYQVIFDFTIIGESSRRQPADTAETEPRKRLTLCRIAQHIELRQDVRSRGKWLTAEDLFAYIIPITIGGIEPGRSLILQRKRSVEWRR